MYRICDKSDFCCIFWHSAMYKQSIGYVFAGENMLRCLDTYLQYILKILTYIIFHIYICVTVWGKTRLSTRWTQLMLLYIYITRFYVNFIFQPCAIIFINFSVRRATVRTVENLYQIFPFAFYNYNGPLQGASNSRCGGSSFKASGRAREI